MANDRLFYSVVIAAGAFTVAAFAAVVLIL
jgi:hypothetical protein